MDFSSLWQKIKSRPITRVFTVLIVSGLIFLVMSPILSRLNFLSFNTSLSAPSSEKGFSTGMALPDYSRSYYYSPLLFLVKPLFYVGLFVLVYFLLFNKKVKFDFGKLLFEFGFLIIFIIFIFSSADLIRIGMNGYLRKLNLGSSYYYERFARRVAGRLAALLLTLPLFVFFNYRLIKMKSIEVFTLILATLTGFFNLILTYFLLYGLFLIALGVKGVDLADYTFPLAYFSILFPLTLLYLTVYLKKSRV